MATGAGGPTNTTAVGFHALVGRSNSLVPGSWAHSPDFWQYDTDVGICTTAPSDRLTVQTSTNSYGIVHTDGTITVGTLVASEEE